MNFRPMGDNMWRRTIVTGSIVIALSAAALPSALADGRATASCGSVVSKSIVLTGDLACAADGLIVDGVGTITIDLNGFAIQGTGTGTGLELRNATRVRVRRGAINGFRTAVVAHSPAVLTDLTFSGNTAPASPGGASDVVATAPIVARHLSGTGSVAASLHTGSVFADVKFASLVLLLVRESTISNSRFGSISSRDSFDIHLRRNVLGRVSVLQSDGFEIVGNDITTLAVGQSRGTTISRNRFRNAEVALEFSPQGDPSNLIRDNLFEGNDIGIRLRFHLASATTIAGNHFRNNTTAGLDADMGGSGGTVTISDNVFVANGAASTTVDSTGSAIDDGMHVVAGGNAVVHVGGNRADRNADLGIEAIGVIDDGANTARGNGNPQQCLGVVCG